MHTEMSTLGVFLKRILSRRQWLKRHVSGQQLLCLAADTGWGKVLIHLCADYLKDWFPRYNLQCHLFEFHRGVAEWVLWQELACPHFLLFRATWLILYKYQPPHLMEKRTELSGEILGELEVRSSVCKIWIQFIFSICNSTNCNCIYVLKLQVQLCLH